MKIVQISANFPPKECGIGDYTRLLCEEMSLKEEALFYVITSSDPKIKESGYSHEMVKIMPEITNWSFSGIKQIRRIIKEVSPDIVHIEYNRMLYNREVAINFLPYFLKQDGVAAKVVVTFHDLPGPVKNRDFFFWLTTLALLVYCGRVIVTNELDLNSFTSRLFFVKKKCTLVPVGSNILKAGASRSAVRRKLGVSDDALMLAFFGFIREDKCLSDLFYAFLRLWRAGCKARLLIIGGILNNEIYLSFRKLSRKLNIDDMVIWINYQPGAKISELLAASDIAVLPYKNGIGTNSGAFAACALHGLPIVATAAKFMPDVIKDNYNLILVKPNSINEIRNAVLRIAWDPDLRNKLSVNLKGINEYLSWENISARIFKLYTELIPKC